MKELGFKKFFAQKGFSQLEVWRSAIQYYISEDEMKGLWNTNGRLPDSVVHLFICNKEGKCHIFTYKVMR